MERGIILTKVNKEELLLESFEILKRNLEENSSKIKDIIVKIAKMNTPLAVDMWRYALSNSKSYLKEDGYYYTSGMMYGLSKKIGEEEVLNILNENDDILEYTFGKAYDISEGTLWDALKAGNNELANKMYVLIKDNPHKDDSLAEIIDTLCTYFADEFGHLKEDEDEDDYDDDDFYDEDDQKEADLAAEIASVLLEWGSRLKDKEVKAGITVTLIDYI